MNVNQKGFANIVLIIIVVLTVIVGYFAFVKKSGHVVQQSPSSATNTSVSNTTLPNPTPTPTSTSQPTPKQIITTPISVSGMSKHTDTDFGFSFWYPSGWTIMESAITYPDYYSFLSGGTVIYKSLKLSSNNGTDIKLRIDEVSSPTRTLSDLASYCSIGADAAGSCGYVLYYFDVNTHTWMMERPASVGYGGKDGTPYTIATTTQVADVSQNTMGGLHMFSNSDSHHQDAIVPLSAKNFVVVHRDSIDNLPFTKTIVATDSSVATPVGSAQQIQTIQAEKKAYFGQ